MATANERIADRFVRRDIDLAKFLRGAKAETIAKVDQLARDLQRLVAANDPTSPLQQTYRELRMRRLLLEAAKAIRDAYTEIGTVHREQSRLLAALESKAALTAINKAVGVEVATVALTRSQIAAVTNDTVVVGIPVRKLFTRAADATINRFADEMRRGFRAGETIAQLTQRVQSKAFIDATRSGAETAVRTSFQAITNEARKVVAENNADVIKGVQQRSTLDGRTSQVCIAYSGMSWTIPDYEPIDNALPFNGGPPRHPRCRSTLTYITKSWDELRGRRLPGAPGMPSQSIQNRFRDRLAAQGLSDEAIDRAVERAQASMDGQVPSDWNFETWLSSKSEAFQKETLGPGRWELWNNGDIELRDLIDKMGRPLTLEQLEART